MANNQPLTQEQLEDAARLRSVFQEAKTRNRSITQEKVALACGWTQGAVSQYLRGKIPLNLNAVVRLSKELGVSPSAISPSLAATLDNTAPVLPAEITENPDLAALPAGCRFYLDLQIRRINDALSRTPPLLRMALENVPMPGLEEEWEQRFEEWLFDLPSAVERLPISGGSLKVNTDQRANATKRKKV